MSGFASYRKVTAEPKEAEVVTMDDLLAVVMEAGFGVNVLVEVFDANGHRHDVQVSYMGESTGLARAAINFGGR